MKTSLFHQFLLLLGGLLSATVASAAAPVYSRSWIGNSFGTGGQANGKWVQINIAGLWVAPNGRCYTASSWDEAKREGGIYQDGDVVGTLQNLHPDEGGSWTGVSAITGTNSHVYIGVNQSIRRYSLTGGHSGFAGGTGNWTNEVKVAPGTGRISGLTADTTNGRIFAAFRGVPDEVVVVAASTMSVVTRWTLPRAGRCAVAPDGTLWIAQEADAPGGIAAKILHFSADGIQLPGEISESAGFTPTALHFNAAGQLLIADNGPDQQVKIFDVSAAVPLPAGTFGAKGGIYSGVAGVVAPLKFCGLTGVGTDAAGNIYVSQNRFGPEVNSGTGAGSNLESYAPAGVRNWQVLGLEFVDGGDFVPGTDGAQVHSKYTRYTLDLAKTVPGSEWSYSAHTLNQFKYPNDPRYLRRNDSFDFSTAAFVRVLAGQRFVFNTSMWGRRLEVYRFNEATDGEIAIPCGFIRGGGGGLTNAPANGEYIWRDLNGNGNPETSEFSQKPGLGNAGGHSETLLGWWIDENGGMWQGNHYNPNQLRYFLFGGLDGNGCPIWSYATMQTFSAPQPFTGSGAGVFRVQYSAITDTLYVAGYTSAAPALAGFDVKLIGRVVARYDGWLAGNRNPTWTNTLWDAAGSANKGPVSMRVAGDFMFIGYDGLPYQPDSGFVRVFRSTDGGYAGRLWAGSNASGRMDITYGVSATKRANGEYLILAEEDWYARQMLYRWTPATLQPSIPAVTAAAGNTTSSLQWTASPDAGFCAVQRALSSSGPFTTLVHDTEKTAHVESSLANGTPYFYRILAGGPGGDAISEPIRVVPSADIPLQINAGGQSIDAWIGDLYHNGQYTDSTTATVNTAAAGAGPPAMYQSARAGSFTYTIPGQKPGRSYIVKLHFSENNSGLVYYRKFNVDINGARVLTNFIVGMAAGARTNVAVVKEFPGVVTNTSGQIVIKFSDVAYGALVNGIEIVGDPTVPEVPPLFTAQQQAEAAVRSAGITMEADHTGFTGSGYLNFPTSGAAYVEFNINVPVAGTYSLNLRHALGAASPRSVVLAVNGGPARILDFPVTGAWTAWTDFPVTGSLIAGNNSIRVSTGTDGPNLDRLDLTGTLPSAYLVQWAEPFGLNLGAIGEDTDGDGFATLLEYFTGGNPIVSAATAGVPQFTRIPGNLVEITYLRRIDHLVRGLTHHFEGSSTLDNPGWIPLSATQVGAAVASGDGITERVTIRATVPGDPQRFFCRLNVTLNN